MPKVFACCRVGHGGQQLVHPKKDLWRPWPSEEHDKRLLLDWALSLGYTIATGDHESDHVVAGQRASRICQACMRTFHRHRATRPFLFAAPAGEGAAPTHVAPHIMQTDAPPAVAADANAPDMMQADALLAVAADATAPDMMQVDASSDGNSDSDGTSNRGHGIPDSAQLHAACPADRLLGHVRVGSGPASSGDLKWGAKSARVPLFPRRKAGDVDSAVSCRGRDPVNLGYDVLEPLFELPQNAAAKSIGISLTALKQVCRKLGIERWPYRRTSKSHIKTDPCGVDHCGVIGLVSLGTAVTVKKTAADPKAPSAYGAN